MSHCAGRASTRRQLEGPSHYLSIRLHKNLEVVTAILDLFSFLNLNVYGIHIRVSEQDTQCLFRSYKDLLRAQ